MDERYAQTVRLLTLPNRIDNALHEYVLGENQQIHHWW